jgi:hypothetical protein
MDSIGLLDMDNAEADWMTAWNEGVRDRDPVGIRETARLCQQQMQDCAETSSPGIWMAHLLNLFDEGQIGREDLLNLARDHHQMQRDRGSQS